MTESEKNEITKKPPTEKKRTIETLQAPTKTRPRDPPPSDEGSES